MTTLRPEVLSKYQNDMFVETGTYAGAACLVAIQTGFKKVVSFEVSPLKFNLASERLSQFPQVSLFFGDTVEMLPKVLNVISVQCTFWLDAHFPEDNAVRTSKGWSCCPIMLELAAIERHPIKTHTIMIDDLGIFRQGVYDHISEVQLKDALLKINPNYRFVYENGQSKDTVLVAVPSCILNDKFCATGP